MESSEEDDDFPSIESITPQSKVDSLYQSRSEKIYLLMETYDARVTMLIRSESYLDVKMIKGIRKLCCELLDLKDAVENLCGNMRTKYLAFLRISEEAVEMEHELVELRKHISTQRILVQDLMTGVCHQLEQWNQSTSEVEPNPDICELQDPLPIETDNHKIFLEKIDVLLAEHKVEEALEALDAEERNSPELKSSGDTSTTDGSSYRSDFLKRKALLEDQLVEITGQPFISFVELKKALSGLIKLGKGPLAHQLLLKFYGSHIEKSTEALFPSSSVCPKTYPATLSKLVFSTISLATMKSGLVFGDDRVYTNRVVQWAEWEIEYFVRLVKENAPSSDTVSALRAASICVQASLNYSLMLERQGLKLSKLILVLLRPFIEEVLELNFRRARKVVLDLVEADECMSFSPRFAPPLSAFTTSSHSLIADSGIRFMCIVEDILEQLTPLTILHFGGNILSRIGHLFDKYMDALIKALPGPSDDDSLTELKEFVSFRAETDSEQLALLGVAFTILDELLPNAVMTLWKQQTESGEPKSGLAENVTPIPSTSTELKDWRRRLQHSFDKLRDHFCRQYVLSFIYSREGQTRLDAQIYLNGNGDDLYWDSAPLPSLPFQALFAKLQQLATVAGDVLLGKDRIQKILLARLTETVVMWLSDEQEFWAVFEDDTGPLQPLGLQQLILDMHFTVEIARFAGYPSRHVHQIASAIIARAIRAFSARGIEVQSALSEDEWFVETAKLAINKLLLGADLSETSDIDEDNIALHDHVVLDSDDSVSSLSSIDSSESFASANMGELDSPKHFEDSEG